MKDLKSWKNKNISTFDKIVSIKDKNKFLKEIKRNDIKKEYSDIIGTLFDLCKYMCSFFGLVVESNKVKGKFYKNSFYTCSGMNWIMEFLMFDKERSREIVRVLLLTEFILIKNKEVEDIDSVHSLSQFNIHKLPFLKEDTNSYNRYISFGENMFEQSKINKKKNDNILDEYLNNTNIDMVDLSIFIEEEDDFKAEECHNIPNIEEEEKISCISNYFNQENCHIYSAKLNNEECFVMLEIIHDRVISDKKLKKGFLVSSDSIENPTNFEIPALLTEREIELKLNISQMKLINNDIFPLLLEFEENFNDEATKYKIGVIYSKKENLREELFLSEENGTSEEFEKFLSQMGEKVKLKNFDQFDGNLDTKNNTTGEYSYYTPYKGNEIMYHVSSLLPQNTKKKFFYNDIVLIIFCDTTDIVFSPKIFPSPMIQVIIVVCVHQVVDGVTHYRVEVLQRNKKKDTPPYLPKPPIFKEGPHFTKFILSKIINSERISISSSRNLYNNLKTRKLEFLKQVLNTSNLIEPITPRSSSAEEKNFFISPFMHALETSKILDNDKNDEVNVEHIKQVSLRILKPKEWKILELLGEEIRYKRNEVICHSGKNDNLFYKVVSGEVGFIVNDIPIFRINTGYFRNYVIPTYDSSKFVSNSTNTVLLVIHYNKLLSYFESDIYLAKIFFQTECVFMSSLCNIVSRNVHKSTTHQLLVSQEIEISSKTNELTLNTLFNFSFPQLLIKTFPCYLSKITKVNGVCFIFEHYLCFHG
eukprot:TRINITY_DN6862_c0_g1_i1.p1 TRINITY_DN6862_c0_g1~~TRINITY_DN6862_c0_g1_i1.p1  ORF type:complete len:779 (+),score=198.64 TRINITY_DN6862_c0_g1_i1:64-2337(+)